MEQCYLCFLHLYIPIYVSLFFELFCFALYQQFSAVPHPNVKVCRSGRFRLFRPFREISFSCFDFESNRIVPCSNDLFMVNAGNGVCFRYDGFDVDALQALERYCGRTKNCTEKASAPVQSTKHNVQCQYLKARHRAVIASSTIRRRITCTLNAILIVVADIYSAQPDLCRPPTCFLS